MSQVPIGPIYLLDAGLVAAVALRPFAVLRALVRLWPALIIMLAGLAWVTFEVTTSSFDPLALRRSAMAAYGLVPVVLWTYRREALSWMTRRPAVASLLIVSLSLVLPRASHAVGAFVAVALVLAAAFAPGVGRRLANVLVSLAVTMTLIFGLFASGDIFRTPLLSAVVAIGLLFPYAAWRAIATRRARRLWVITASAAIALSLASPLVPQVRLVVGTMLAAVAGVTGSATIEDVALALNPDRNRARGDTVGTGIDRVRFLTDIIAFNNEEAGRFFIGSGHASSFFEAVRPGGEFYDAHLLEPHNSFFGAFYRYGILGVIGFVMLIGFVVAQVLVATSREQRGWVLASVAVALVYASFEVALEAPHGAVVFWSILILPAASGAAVRGVPCSTAA